MKLEIIIVSETSQTKIEHAVKFHLHKVILNVNDSAVKENRYRLSGDSIGIRATIGKDSKRCQAFEKNDSVHYCNCDDGFSSVYIYQNLPNCTL